MRFIQLTRNENISNDEVFLINIDHIESISICEKDNSTCIYNTCFEKQYKVKESLCTVVKKIKDAGGKVII